MMKFIVLTLFPELLAAFWDNGIVRRAVHSGTIQPAAINIRDYAAGRHRVTDDRPYGGGCGMVMKPEPLAGALRAARDAAPDATVVLLSPQGRPFDQGLARRLSAAAGLILICGRYEGIDERVSEQFVDLEISIGDYVLTGGELPAMVVMDAVTRLLPGALGNEASAGQDSFGAERLDCAHYTRPPEFEGRTVPEVLLSGHHKEVARWRRADALMRTLVKRPDLLERTALSALELDLLAQWHREIDRLLHAQGIDRVDPSSGDR